MKALHPSRLVLLAAFVFLLPGLLLAQGRGPGGPGGPGSPGGPGGGGMGGGRPGMPGGGGGGGPMGAPRNSGGGNPGHSPNAGGPSHGGPQLGLPGRWWDDKKTIRTLNLRHDQQQRMDSIFNDNKGALFNSYAALEQEQKRLSSLSSQDLKDENKVFAAIDRVAQARADLAKQNTHILLRLRKELDPDQLASLDKALNAQR